MSTTNEEKIALYPKTENFEVKDTIGVPHLYCITPKHLKHNDSMYIGGEQIRAIEKKIGNCCGIRDCNLPYDHHETAVAVHCKSKDEELTKEYLKLIVKQVEADGFAGFVLVDATKNNKQ